MCTVVKMTPGHCKLDWEFGILESGNTEAFTAVPLVYKAAPLLRL